RPGAGGGAGGRHLGRGSPARRASGDRRRRGRGLMAAFDYIAADAAGRMVSGSVTAVDEVGARKALAKRQLALLQLSPGRSGAVVAPSKVGKAGRLSPKTLALTTRQLATLISVSPLEEALRNLMLQA